MADGRWALGGKGVMIALFLESTIDVSGMGETTRALLWVIGLLASGGGCYLLGTKKKVQLDPNTVAAEPSRCELIRQSNEDEHKNAFARLSSLEQRVSNLEGQMVHIGMSLQRIENKLDDLRGNCHA